MIRVLNRQRRIAVKLPALQTFAESALSACLKLRPRKSAVLKELAEINVILVSDKRIAQIHREDGVTILLVEQRVAEALERSDHGYVLETGHIVLEGPYETLLADDRVRR